MDYEQKYKEALERAKCEWVKNLDNAYKNYRERLESIFPELKESEDERIRRNIIAALKGEGYYDCDLTNECIAWVEKQGNCSAKWEKNTPDNKPAINHTVLMKTTIGIVEGEWRGEYWFQYRWSCRLKDSEVLYWMNLYELEKLGEEKPFDYESANIQQKDFASVGETATIELSSPIDCGDRIYHVSHKPIEKQGEQKPAVTDFNAKDWYVSKVDGKIHDMTYNPADKVEPKFKIGDYIVSDYCMGRVVEITSDAYLLDIGQGIPFSCEDKVHLWTIADAKDGDVLVDVYGNIGIFQKNDDFDWSSYCSLGSNGGFRCFAIEHELDRSHPATKEQRDTLEKAMADAGYTFDFEKKELKKPQRMISAEAKEALYDKVEPKFNIGDVLCDKSCTTLDKNSQPNIEILDIRAGMYICNNCSFPISQQDEYELVAKRIVPQSAAWSDEDENYLQSAENACEYQYGKNTSTILWLKSLKDRVQPQPKQEWSEEDKQEVEEFLKSLQQRFQPSLLTIVDWLKSLKNRMQK